jgi:hypothetical protein
MNRIQKSSVSRASTIVNCLRLSPGVAVADDRAFASSGAVVCTDLPPPSFHRRPLSADALTTARGSSERVARKSSRQPRIPTVAAVRPWVPGPSFEGQICVASTEPTSCSPLRLNIS